MRVDDNAPRTANQARSDVVLWRGAPGSDTVLHMAWNLRALPSERKWPLAGALFFVSYVVLMVALFDDSLLSAIVGGLFVATFWTIVMAWWEQGHRRAGQDSGSR